VENICRSKSSKQFSSKVPNIWNNLSDPPNSQTVHRMSMLGDLDKDCKTLEAESWHKWQRDLCLGFPLFEKYVELDYPSL
jgi:hypothetical protein